MKRRGFLGAALVSLGAAAGWATRRLFNSGAPPALRSDPTSNRFAYDVTEFESVSPDLLLYRAGARVELPFERVKQIIAAPNDLFWIAGDRSIKLLNPRGRVERQIDLNRPPHAIHLLGDGEVLVASGVDFEIFDRAGSRRLRSASLGPTTFLTSVAVDNQNVYLADAGNREIIVCDLDTGAVLDRFGKRDPARGNPGFAVPSPYFDLAIVNDQLVAANPGRLRMETYSLDGRYQGAWGEPGLQIAKFCGCCNPIFFCLNPSGGFITSEKGLPRIKVYDATGAFKGVAASPEMLLDGRHPAPKSKLAFDVAVDGAGRVMALDLEAGVLRYFEPLQSSTAT